MKTKVQRKGFLGSDRHSCQAMAAIAITPGGVVDSDNWPRVDQTLEIVLPIEIVLA